MLQLKPGFILREIAGETVVIPSGTELDVNMMITLNDTGAFLWKHIANGIEREMLISLLLSEYDANEKTATEAVDAFVAQLRENGFLL
ncbi:MAG: PqqD family protein [Oscillospiraceae bacterium]|nr:PqqD family protein [Oscillospiraceae bacterium]